MENEQNVLRSIVASTVVVVDTSADSSASTDNGALSTSMSDEKLFELCRQYGRNALEWRRKFLGLLPEVAKRKLYEKRGFSSIFEFGFKLAGVSENQIRKVLNLEIRFRDKRILHGLLVEGKVSVNKLAKIAPIATAENQKVLAEQVRVLPCGALETLARDEKNLVKSNLQNAHVSTQPSQIGLFGKSGVSSETVKDSVEVRFSEEVKRRLIELQKKGININELLVEFLDKREKGIREEKENIVQGMEVKNGNNSAMNSLEFAEKAARRLSESLIEAIGDDVVVQSFNGLIRESKDSSRHVPMKIQKIIKKEYGTKCAVPTCNKPAQHLHHTLPFALSQNHDPHYLMPLCKEHHLIAHSIDQKFHEVRQMVT